MLCSNVFMTCLMIVQLIQENVASSHDSDIVVLDTSSGMVKAGFAGEPSPLAYFKAVIGRPKQNNKDLKGLYIGESAEIKDNILHLSYPVENGTFTNIDDMKIIWNHTFIKRIRVNSEDHPVLFIESIMDTTQNRQAVADIMFNVFKIPALYIANHAWLSLYSTNRDTGIIMNSDSGLTYAVPIVKGKVISHAILSLNLGGRDLTQCLIKLRNTTLINVKKMGIIYVDDIRDKLCYVAFDFEKELSIAMSSSSSDGNYELPDGTVVTLESERFRCPEGMFKPSLIGKNVPGIHEMLYNSIMKCDADQRQALFGNIVLTGSTTSLPGFEQRFSAEIAHLAPSTMKVKVMALPSRVDLAWNGGSKLASEPTFRKMLITRKDYEEFGPSLIN